MLPCRCAFYLRSWSGRLPGPFVCLPGALGGTSIFWLRVFGLNVALAARWKAFRSRNRQRSSGVSRLAAGNVARLPPCPRCGAPDLSKALVLVSYSASWRISACYTAFVEADPWRGERPRTAGFFGVVSLLARCCPLWQKRRCPLHILTIRHRRGPPARLLENYPAGRHGGALRARHEPPRPRHGQPDGDVRDDEGRV